MNSVILSSISAFCKKTADVFKKSAVAGILTAIYTFFSNSWKNSCIMNFLRKNGENKILENSFLYKTVYMPFKFAEKIAVKLRAWITKEIKNSVILGAYRDFVHSALALNTRFYGLIFLSALAARSILSDNVSWIYVAVAFAAAVFAWTDTDVTAILSDSKIFRLCLSFVGFENISLDIYKKKSVNTVSARITAILCGAAIGVLSVKSALLSLALPIGITGVGIVMMYPVSGIFFALFAAPFVPTMLLAGLCVLTFCAMAVKALSEKNFRFKLDGVGVGLGFFLLFMFISSVFSFSAFKSLMVWGMYLIFVGFYFVIINTVETKQQLYAILKVFVIACALVSLYGVLQYVFGWNTSNAWIDENMFEEATMRAYSTMENPNVLGELLLLSIPLTAVFMIKAEKMREKLFYIAVFLISVLCMVFTQSRGCWLGLMLCAVVFVTFYNGKLWGLLPIVLLILPFVIPETMVDRMMSVGNLEDSSTSYRVFIWLGTLEMLKDFWLGGIGMGEGAFRTVYPIYSYNAIIAPHSHNTFLQLWVEGGICALITFIVIMIVFIKKTSDIYRKNEKNSFDRLLSLAIGSGVIGFLLQSMFDYTFYNYRMMAMFFMVIALCVSIGYAKDKTVYGKE